MIPLPENPLISSPSILGPLIRGAALGAALLGAPLAASAQSQHQAISSDGKGLSAVEAAFGVRESESFAGRPGTGSGSALAETLSGEELAAMLALKPMTAPKGIESIIGPDQRVRVRNTKAYPYRAVVLITFSTPGGSSRCTGWLINKNTVATAGHCVYDPGVGFYSRASFTLYPGYTGSSAPYGSCKAKRLYTVTGWANSGNDQYDYGAIKLNCNVGNTVGWFGYFWQSASLTGRPTRIAGYPGDKPLTQWYSNGKVTVTQARRVFYKNDTVGGMSGSPVYYNRSSTCNPCSMAVHAYGTYGSPPFSTNNHGTRIVKAVFDNFAAWKAAN